MYTVGTFAQGIMTNWADPERVAAIALMEAQQNRLIFPAKDDVSTALKIGILVGKAQCPEAFLESFATLLAGPTLQAQFKTPKRVVVLIRDATNDSYRVVLFQGSAKGKASIFVASIFMDSKKDPANCAQSIQEMMTSFDVDEECVVRTAITCPLPLDEIIGHAHDSLICIIPNADMINGLETSFRRSGLQKSSGFKR